MDLIDKILGLKELGYSKSEIDSLISGINKDTPKEEDIKLVELPIDDVKEEKKDEAGVQSTSDDITTDRLKSIEETLKQIQSNNIKWSNLPSEEPKTELEIVQEILGGISKNGNE